MALALFLAAALGTLAAAARWLRPISWGTRAALLAIALLVPGPALLLGHVFAPVDAPYTFLPLAGLPETQKPPQTSPRILSDVHTQILPWRAAVRHGFSLGEWPLWNPFVQCGDPLAGSAQSAPYFPSNLLALALPLEDGPGSAAAWVLFSAALGAFLALRGLDCREPAALVGAAGWSLSSFLLFWQAWPLAQTVALLPLLLFAVDRLVEAASAGRALFLAATLALVLLTGHPESMLHLVVVGTVWGLARLRPRSWEERRRAVASALGAGALAAGLSAFFLLPFATLLPHTTEHYVRAVRLRHVSPDRPLAEAVELLQADLVPFAHGVPGRELAPGDEIFWLPSTGYAGSLLLVPALVGLLATRRPERWPLAALALFGAAAGAGLPPVLGLLHRLPLFSISLNERLVFLTPLALAFLAAFGAEAWLGEREAARRRARTLGAGLAVGVASLLALLVATAWSAMTARGLSDRFLLEQTAWSIVPLLLLAALLATRWRPHAVVLALLALLALQRSGEAGTFQASVERRFFYPLVAPLTALPETSEPYRVVGLDGALLPNSGTLWGLEDARGDNAFTLLRLVETRRLLGRPRDISRLLVDSLEPAFLDFMNVRFALAAEGSAVPTRWREVARANGTVLLENGRALPRAFVPRSVRVGRDGERLLTELAASSRFGQRAWIEPHDRDAPAEPVTRPNGPGETATRREGLGYRIATRLERDSWVTVAVTAWPGWRATLDGERLPTGYADHAFLAIRVPAGDHEVALRYRPRAFDLGLGLSALSLLAFLTVAVRGVRRRRVPT